MIKSVRDRIVRLQEQCASGIRAGEDNVSTHSKKTSLRARQIAHFPKAVL
jgi:hypothetical protein